MQFLFFVDHILKRSVLRLLADFVCLLTYEFCLSLWKIARCSVILLLPLFGIVSPYWLISLLLLTLLLD